MKVKKSLGLVRVGVARTRRVNTQHSTREAERSQLLGLGLLLAARLFCLPGTVLGQQADLMLTQEARDSNPKKWAFFAAAYGWLAGVDGTVAVGYSVARNGRFWAPCATTT
jgi:hypothetical protein